MSVLARELHCAFRGVRKNPGTTAIILLALALGIGVNASCFITVSAIILHPLPYPELDRIMTVWEAPANLHGERGAAAPANFLDWKQQSRSFGYLAALRGWNANLSGSGEPERLQACRVSADYFGVLGMTPEMGRTFRNEEIEGVSGRVAVVSNGFWKRRLASARDVIGKTVLLDSEVYTIVGVMPEEFNFPLETEVWAPLTLTASERHGRDSHNLAVLGRLKRSIPVEQARAEMNTIGRRLAAAHPDSNENRDVLVIPIRELTNNVTDRFTWTLLVTAGFVLLLASANVANLLLVRLASRRKEIAIRSALGAGRSRILRQLLVESVMMALVAGGLGLLLASWNLTLMHWLIPAEVARWVAGIRNMRIDGFVIMGTIVLSFVTGLLTMAPGAIHLMRGATSVDMNEALKEGGRGGTAGQARSRLRTMLAVAEVALALVLLVGAGVMVQTFQRLLTISPGFNTANLLTMKIALPQSKVATPTQTSGFYRRLLGGLDTIPVAKATALSAELGPAGAVFIEGRLDPRPGEPVPDVKAVSSRYFQTLGLPLVRGLGVAEQDDKDHQTVVVVSQAVARHYWPDSDPIGRRIRFSKSDPWLTVAGVSGDVKEWFTGQPIPQAYVSFLQTPRADTSIFIRTSGDPFQAAAAATGAVWNVDRSQPVFDVKSMEQTILEQTSGVRAAAVSMAMYALISLALAVTGIYAVISYSVAQRTHEIGLRMALGAARADVVKMTLLEALRVGVIGLTVGVPIAFILIRLMASVLYGVVRLEASVFVGMILVLAISAAAAGYVPAMRAARVDPVTALRNE